MSDGFPYTQNKALSSEEQQGLFWPHRPIVRAVRISCQKTMIDEVHYTIFP